MIRTQGRIFLILTAFLFLFSCIPAVPAAAEEVTEELLLDDESGDQAESADPEPSSPTARDAFIEDIIELGRSLYDKADGKYQRAHYKGDIYVCKNFTVYLFRQNRDKYRMAEYPEKELKIPNNLPAKKCKPYSYGYCWEDIAASDGNPFEVAAQFLYDKQWPRQLEISCYHCQQAG